MTWLTCINMINMCDVRIQNFFWYFYNIYIYSIYNIYKYINILYIYILYYLYIYIYMRPVSELWDSPNKKKDQFVCTLHTFRHFDMALFAERKACRFTIQGWRVPKSKVPNQIPRTPTRTCFKNSHGFFPQFCWGVQRVQTLQVVNGHGSQMLNLWVPWL